MVGRLELRRRDIATGRVETLGVPPGHPGRCGELDLVGRPPEALGADELGLVEAVDRLGEGVIVGITLGADRGDRTLVGEALGVPDREVLGPRSL